MGRLHATFFDSGQHIGQHRPTRPTHDLASKGPPGTGKSRTLHATMLCALLEAIAANRPLRVLITGPTYEAIDNVLLPLYEHLLGPGPFASPQVSTYRLRSETPDR